MSIPVLRQNKSFSVFRIFRALPVPLAKFYYQIYTFHQISHTFGFGVADSDPETKSVGNLMKRVDLVMYWCSPTSWP